MERHSLLLSALCHDVDHTGRNNAFECSSYSRVAIKYNDDAVLENHHAATTFKLLLQDKYNILSKVTDQDFKLMRKFIISNILYTDMKKHFELIKAFQVKAPSFKENIEEFKRNELDKKILCGTILHAADLYTPTKNFETSFAWASKINQEFTNQVNEEISLGLPPAPYMQNLDKLEIMAKQEIGFISAIVRPLWTEINAFFNGSLNELIENCDRNLEEWKEIKAKSEPK